MVAAYGSPWVRVVVRIGMAELGAYGLVWALSKATGDALGCSWTDYWERGPNKMRTVDIVMLKGVIGFRRGCSE